MKDASDRTASSATWRENDARTRPLMPVGGAFITAFVVAMHQSRERQAARAIRQHRHLAHQADAYEDRRLAEPKRDLLQNRVSNMIDGPRTRRSHSAGLALAGKILIATALIAFGVMHFIGDAIIRSASSPASAVTIQRTLGAD